MADGRAARQGSLREHNLGLAMRQVADAPDPVSRADIAAATGLTRATVSALVDRLIAFRMVSELRPVAGQRGRPGVPLVAARRTIAALGMEVNVDYLGVRAIDLSGAVLADHVESDDFRGSHPGPALARLAAIASEVVAELRAQGIAVAGAGLALPGLVDRSGGLLRIAPNLGWRDVDAAALVSPALAPIPILPANEADLAARAEAHARRGGGPASFIYVSGEVGIGGAIVVDSEIFAGQNGWSGEIGHTVLGTAGSFDQGATLEAYAGQDALMVAAGLDRNAGIDALLAAAAGRNPRALEALERVGAALGLALANAVNIVGVDEVVLGSHYGALVEQVRAPLLEQLRRRVLAAPWADLRLSAAQAGEYPAMSGGALTVLRAVINDPAGWSVGGSGR